jgi:hypothetical protein
VPVEFAGTGFGTADVIAPFVVSDNRTLSHA